MSLRVGLFVHFFDLAKLAGFGTKSDQIQTDITAARTSLSLKVIYITYVQASLDWTVLHMGWCHHYSITILT